MTLNDLSYRKGIFLYTGARPSIVALPSTVEAIESTSTLRHASPSTVESQQPLPTLSQSAFTVTQSTFTQTCTSNAIVTPRGTVSSTAHIISNSTATSITSG